MEQETWARLSPIIHGWGSMSHQQRVEVWNPLTHDNKVDLFVNLFNVTDRDSWWRNMPGRESGMADADLPFWRDADALGKFRILRAVGEDLAESLCEEGLDDAHVVEICDAVDDYELDSALNNAPLAVLAAFFKAQTTREDQLDYFRARGPVIQAEMLPIMTKEERVGAWRELDSEERGDWWGELDLDERVSLICDLPLDLQDQWFSELDNKELSEWVMRTNTDQRRKLWEMRGDDNGQTAPTAAQQGFLDRMDPQARAAVICDLDREVARAILKDFDSEQFMEIYEVAELEHHPFLLSIVPPERVIQLHLAAHTSLRDEVNQMWSNPGFRSSACDSQGAPANAVRDALLGRLDQIDHDTRSNLEAAENDWAKYSEDPITLGPLRAKRAAALEKAQLDRLHVMNFSLVCMRVNAIFKGEEDPVLKVPLTLPELDLVERQMAKIILAFSRLEDGVPIADREADNARNMLLLQCEDGTVNCEANVGRVVSAMSFICDSFEAKRYRNLLTALRACMGAQGREMIGKIGILATKQRSFQGESSETFLKVETVLGEKFDIPDTRREGIHGSIGASDEEIPAWNALMGATRANNGRGDEEALSQVLEPKLKIANETLAEELELKKLRGEADPNEEFRPLQLKLRMLLDFLKNEERWNNVLVQVLKTRFTEKLDPSHNTTVKEAQDTVDNDHLETHMPLFEAQVTFRTAESTGGQLPEIVLEGESTPLTKDDVIERVKAADRERDQKLEKCKNDYCQAWIAPLLDALYDTEQALQAHVGTTWKLPSDKLIADRELSVDYLNPMDQLQLERVREHRPKIEEIELVGEHTDNDEVRLWIAAKIQGFSVKGLSDQSEIVTWRHHEMLAKKCREVQSFLVGPEDEAERKRLEQLINTQKVHSRRKHTAWVAKTFNIPAERLTLLELDDQRKKLEGNESFRAIRLREGATRNTSFDDVSYLMVWRDDKNPNLASPRTPGSPDRMTVVYTHKNNVPAVDSKELVEVTRNGINRVVQAHRRTGSEMDRGGSIAAGDRQAELPFSPPPKRKPGGSRR
ncbi:MAG TPA: hypothetical protein VM532_12425 [Burkholderiales bacterium]|nr:hypothetical protein [Burkholderiales bacterium]